MSQTEAKIMEIIAAELKIPLRQVIETIKLLDDGNTVPFIASAQRKSPAELDEEQILPAATGCLSAEPSPAQKKKLCAAFPDRGKLTQNWKSKIQGIQSCSRLRIYTGPTSPSAIPGAARPGMPAWNPWQKFC